MSETNARHQFKALTDLQFLFVTGKGGVGKSTCAALLGLFAASRGKRTLVVVPQTSHNTPSLFGRTLSTDITVMAENLSAVRISPDLAMREYCRQVLRSQTLTNALFHPRVAGGFLGGIPGLNDWALLGKSWAWTKSGQFELPKDQQKYDLVLFDAPASGDGTKMLKVPQVIMDLSPQGRLRDDAAACQEMLSDERRSAVLVVSLADAFSITETEENLAFLNQELKLPLGPLIFNRLVSRELESGDCERLEHAQQMLSAESGSTEQELSLVIAAALRHEKRRSAQLKQLSRIQSWGHETIEVPEITGDLSTLGSLNELLHAVVGSISG